jgi:hypothetical protein
LSDAATDATIYTFDFSIPMLDVAKTNIGDARNVVLFRANARGAIPFHEGSFDAILQRLAPFGPHSMRSPEWSLKYLRTGGSYLFGGFEHEWMTPDEFEAMGYEEIEHHRWRFPWVDSDEAFIASHMEGGKTREQSTEALAQNKSEQGRDDGVARVMKEHLFIGRKPG